VTDLLEILAEAREHAARLKNDIELCSSREEHIRISARANEADLLVDSLSGLYVKMETGNPVG
jgi:hypothetical protein